MDTFSRLLARQGSDASSADTAAEMLSQWMNPRDVTAVLMVIGGDVVQKALAQTAGCLYTPVVFSFGWVAYTFIALINMIGDGRLLPPPDYPVKVFNLVTGYQRQNKNWVIGRLLRDHESLMARRGPEFHAGFRIVVWEALKNANSMTSHSYRRIHLWGLGVLLLQLAVASIPIVLYRSWGTLLITFAGNILAIAAGALPQWTVEKLPNRQKVKSGAFALTTGNGSSDVMIILPLDEGCLGLMDLSTQETPRHKKPWEKYSSQSEGGPQKRRFSLRRSWSHMMYSHRVGGLPVGFLITRAACIMQSLLWLALLISVSSLEANTWYIVVVGAIGMFQNGYLAAMEVPPEARNLRLREREAIVTHKVMDGIMDLEAIYGIGRPLLLEFFPGPLRPKEVAWWDGRRDAYDADRLRDASRRGWPRTPRGAPGARPTTPPRQPEDTIASDAQEATTDGKTEEKGEGSPAALSSSTLTPLSEAFV